MAELGTKLVFFFIGMAFIIFMGFTGISVIGDANNNLLYLYDLNSNTNNINHSVPSTIMNPSLDVNVQDYNGELLVLYPTLELQLTSLTSDAFRGNFTINVENATNCNIGDAVDLWDDTNYFQGIITGVSGNQITYISQLTRNFETSNTIVKCGAWKMNVDGSTEKKHFISHHLLIEVGILKVLLSLLWIQQILIQILLEISPL